MVSLDTLVVALGRLSWMECHVATQSMFGAAGCGIEKGATHHEHV